MKLTLKLPATAPQGQAMLWRLFEAVTRPTFLVTAAVLLLALVVGVATPAYVGLMGTSPGKLLALPALIVLGLFLLYDKRALIIAILLFRSIGDPLLETTKISVGGTQVGLGLGINLVVMLIASLFVLERPKEFPKALARGWWPFMILAAIGLVITPNKGEGVRVLLAVFSYFSMFIIGTYLTRSRDDFKYCIKLVIASSVLPMIWAVIDMALHARTTQFRLEGAFTHPNIMAFYLTLIISLMLYVLKGSAFTLSRGQRFGATCYMLVQIALLLLTQCRSAWIACAAIFVMYAVIFERKYLLYLLLMPLVAALIPSVRDRILDMTGGNGDDVYMYARLNSFAWRVILWEAGLKWMEPVRYLFGYGLEAFRYHSQTFFPLSGGIDWSPHNLLVQWLFDIGLVGLGAYLFTFWKCIARLRGMYRVDRLASVVFIATMIAHLIVSMSDNLFAYLVFNWYFWFIVGSACTMAPVAIKATRRYIAPGAPPGAAPDVARGIAPGMAAGAAAVPPMRAPR
jgi:O-antigen ligase